MRKVCEFMSEQIVALLLVLYDLFLILFWQLSQKMLQNAIQDNYANIGPCQFAGLTASSTLRSTDLESDSYLGKLVELREAINQVQEACRPGCRWVVGERTLCEL